MEGLRCPASVWLSKGRAMADWPGSADGGVRADAMQLQMRPDERILAHSAVANESSFRLQPSVVKSADKMKGSRAQPKRACR